MNSCELLFWKPSRTVPSLFEVAWTTAGWPWRRLGATRRLSGDMWWQHVVAMGQCQPSISYGPWVVQIPTIRRHMVPMKLSFSFDVNSNSLMGFSGQHHDHKKVLTLQVGDRLKLSWTPSWSPTLFYELGAENLWLDGCKSWWLHPTLVDSSPMSEQMCFKLQNLQLTSHKLARIRCLFSTHLQWLISVENQMWIHSARNVIPLSVVSQPVPGTTSRDATASVGLGAHTKQLWMW